MSAGELEHEWAGTPGRLIRERYRKAAEVSRVPHTWLLAAFRTTSPTMLPYDIAWKPHS